MTETPRPSDFGYSYFDDPDADGYGGYTRESWRGLVSPWDEAKQAVLALRASSAIDLGCAKGFLVADLLAAGIDAVGYDISGYALSFCPELPCHKWDIADGIPTRADVVIALGVLMYLDEAGCDAALRSIHRAAEIGFVFSAHYEGVTQRVPDSLRRITRSPAWWQGTIERAGFRHERSLHYADVYLV